MTKYYFDYAATTKPDDEVLNKYVKIEREYYGNSQSDINIGNFISQAQDKILNELNIKDTHEVIFTSGGTEANNLAILGKYKNNPDKKHFITSEVEHSSVLGSFRELERLGHEVSYIKVNKQGVVDIEKVVDNIKKNTTLVCIMSLNNEIGSVNKINEIFKKVKEKNKNIVTVCDYVQALGKVKIDFTNVDIGTFSGHKVYGLKAIGMMIKEKNIVMNQILCGAKTSIRPGTQSLGLILTFTSTFIQAIQEQEDRLKYILEIQDYFLKNLDNIGSINIRGISIISLTLNINKRAQTVVEALKKENIILSTRSSCSQKLNKSSHVLISLGLNKEEIDKTIRVSFSHKTTKEEVDYLITNLKRMTDK